MAEDEFDGGFDENDPENTDDEFLEKEASEPASKRPKNKPVSPNRTQISNQKRYNAFHQEAADGIFDNTTNKVLAVDIWTVLADIKNDLEEIKRSLVG